MLFDDFQFSKNAHPYGICGDLEGGKSLLANRMAYEAFRCGHMVLVNWTINIDIVCAELGERCRNLYRKIDLMKDDPWSWPCGGARGKDDNRRVFIGIDEGAEFFDQYKSNDPRVQRFWSWVRHTSKRGQNLCILVQRREWITKVLREIIPSWYMCSNLETWRIGAFRLYGMSNYIMANNFDRYGRKIGTVRFLNKKVWGRLYDTSECITIQENTTEYRYFLPIKGGNKRVGFYLWIASMLILVSVGGFVVEFLGIIASILTVYYILYLTRSLRSPRHV